MNIPFQFIPFHFSLKNDAIDFGGHNGPILVNKIMLTNGIKPLQGEQGKGRSMVDKSHSTSTQFAKIPEAPLFPVCSAIFGFLSAKMSPLLCYYFLVSILSFLRLILFESE